MEGQGLGIDEIVQKTVGSYLRPTVEIAPMVMFCDFSPTFAPFVRVETRNDASRKAPQKVFVVYFAGQGRMWQSKHRISFTDVVRGHGRGPWRIVSMCISCRFPIYCMIRSFCKISMSSTRQELRWQKSNTLLSRSFPRLRYEPVMLPGPDPEHNGVLPGEGQRKFDTQWGRLPHEAVRPARFAGVGGGRVRFREAVGEQGPISSKTLFDVSSSSTSTSPDHGETQTTTIRDPYFRKCAAFLSPQSTAVWLFNNFRLRGTAPYARNTPSVYLGLLRCSDEDAEDGQAVDMSITISDPRIVLQNADGSQPIWVHENPARVEEEVDKLERRNLDKLERMLKVLEDRVDD